MQVSRLDWELVMAKLFYSLEEAAAKLGKTPDQVRELATNGQLPEFRDRDRLMFKVEHVDLLAGTDKDEELIPLADSGELEPLSVSSSASAMDVLPQENAKEATGISIFDTDSTEDSDPSAVTQITTASSAPPMKDPGRSGSGSGLLDMTKDVDDTSLGANLLDDVYGGSETVAQQTTEEPAQNEGGLFESAPSGMGEAEAAAVGAAAAPMFVSQEFYDGAGSGLAGGLAFGAVASLLVAGFAVVLGISGTGGDLINTLGDNLWAFVGGLGGLTVLGGLLGWFLGRKS